MPDRSAQEALGGVKQPSHQPLEITTDATTSDHATLATWLRRAISIPLYVGLCALIVVGFPVLIAVAGAVDLLRGGNRRATIRCATLATAYLVLEVTGLIASFALWLWHCLALSAPSEARVHGVSSMSSAYQEANFRLQCWWARMLFQAAVRLFRVRTVVDGDDAVQRGPFILLSRHCSIGDTLLPAVFVAARHGIRLRYIMKRELLWDPCLDIIGNRLPNYFVRRGSGDGAREITGLQQLMQGLGPHDGVVIYPEGTFFTPAERVRALARLADSVRAVLLARATTMRCVLPPRLGGSLGLLAGNDRADAVFCAHTGLEGVDNFRAFLRGALIDRTIRIRLWRVPFAEIPTDRDTQAEWLYEQWKRVDDWVRGFAARRRANHQPVR